ncbi:MAG: ROK family protein [Ilumatobacteraceae bacterium]
MSAQSIVVGIDNGGTSNNVTVLTHDGAFLIDAMTEVPSRVLDGPEIAIGAMVEAFEVGLRVTGRDRRDVAAVGLDTPGPASATGVLSRKGATNFSDEAWWGFDVRAALEAALGLPVVYSNDGNAAAMYAHYAHFGAVSIDRSSISAIVGTGLGGGVIESGRIVAGASGMGGELGHVHIPSAGILEDGQPVPQCNCGFASDAESYASLTGIRKNLLPFWLTRYPDHQLHGVDPVEASKLVRGLAEKQRDPMALAIFEQQAKALGHLFTIAANFTDPDAFFVGGGVVETDPWFRDWYLDTIREHTTLREEQASHVEFALVHDLDMAGARGAALAALRTVG